MLPKIIQYSNIKPRGFSTVQKRYEINPISSFQSLQQSDTVKFQFQNDGWIDPYNSYFLVTVELNETDHPGQQVVLQLDGQSTSLFSELVLQSNNIEIERIGQYDQLGELLYETKLGPLSRIGKNYEGLGFEKLHQNLQISTPVYQQINFQQGVLDANQCYFSNIGYSPNILAPIRRFPAKAAGDAFVLDENTGGMLLAEYNNLDQNQRREAYNHILSISNTGARYDLISSSMDGEYGVDHAESLVYGIQDYRDNVSVQSVKCDKYGYNIPYSTSLSGHKAQYLTNAENVLKIVNGKFTRNSSIRYKDDQQTKTKLLKQTFSVPILSGIIGVLIPEQDWKLIPGQSLGNFQIQVKLNPFAFFSSGADDTGKIIQRKFRVTQIKMVFDVWQFDYLIEQQMKQMLSSENGLVLSSQSWSLGPQYQIQAVSGTIQSSWQINNPIESVKLLVFWFIPTDYLKKPFCRKNFRLSMNIQQIQLKSGIDYIPPYPIQGHAGNVGMNQEILSDNSEFLRELHKAFFKFGNTTSECTINKSSFAVNERPYNVDSIDQIKNGKALFHERRCKGQAYYAISLDSNPYDSDYLSGFNLAARKPLEILIKADETNKYQSDVEMYIMMNHDFYIQFFANQTKTVGQG